MKRGWICSGILAGVIVVPVVAEAYVVVTDQHVDVFGITYSAATGLGARVHASSEDYSPGDVLIYDGPAGTTSVIRPAGSQWDFVGVPAGSPLFAWPQTRPPSGRINAGIEAQSIPTGTFASGVTGDPRAPGTARWLKIELVDVRYFDLGGNPGEADFSMWQAGGTGSVTVWMSTAQGGIDGTDAFFVDEGGHDHVNWGFSAAGYYQIDFRFSGRLSGSSELVTGPVTTWHFGVEHQPLAIPEPGVVALVLVALGGMAGMMRSREAAKNAKD